MDDRELDAGFKRLGASAPFRVDWDGYAAGVFRRLSASERRRRRKVWWLTLGATAAGAAAAWLVAVFTMSAGSIRPTREAVLPVPEETVPVGQVSETDAVGPVASELPLMVCVRRPGGSMILRSTPRAHDETQPFVQRTVCEDGRVGEIRFYGFTPEGREGERYIIVGGDGRSPSDRPTVGF